MLSNSEISRIRSINIQSMLVFVAVMQCGSLLDASVIMDTSSSNVSILLKKFCFNFKSKLFERDGRRLQPTDFAIQLHKELEGIIKDLFLILDTNNNTIKLKASKVH